MPKIVSEAQRRLVHAAANDPKVAKKVGMPVSVAKAGAAEDPGGKLPARKGAPKWKTHRRRKSNA